PRHTTAIPPCPTCSSSRYRPSSTEPPREPRRACRVSTAKPLAMPFARTRTFPSAAPPCPDAREKLFEKLLGLPGEGTGVRPRRERGGVRLGRAPARSRWAAGRRRRGRIELLRSVEVGLLG